VHARCHRGGDVSVTGEARAGKARATPSDLNLTFFTGDR
jgi:hypothetical protein